MRFARLRLNGFKSFVDPTDLVIHDGLTGVVGPNGCGKSNLLEALRWVMGETRASAMRGGGMEDVIFAGAATRSARNFAEVSLSIDNSERLAPSGFNEADTLEIVRRITRDAGSAYKVNGKEVRARDVQMLFADASTGAQSPALVRQGQIAELINAKPKARRRILEEAAGISGLYQRRHEAELKLSGAEQNLLRVDDVIEQLAQQLASLARQARAAARYREIAEELRRAEGLLLWRRWREADQAREQAVLMLAEHLRAALSAEARAREAAGLRATAEEALPPLREEEAIAGAVVARLALQREALSEEETRASAQIVALRARLAQIAQDMEREAALNRDAGETIARLEWELGQIVKASEGHEARLEALAGASAQAGSALAGQEAGLSERSEDVARLAARHQSAQRSEAEAASALARAQEAEGRAVQAAEANEAALAQAGAAFEQAGGVLAQAVEAARAAEAGLSAAEAARAEVQARESAARVARASASGEAGALRAEAAALARLVEREALAGRQVLDLLRVETGYEAALGAALADDLRAPLATEGGSGWGELADYPVAQPLPLGADALADRVQAPAALARRLAQIGLVLDAAQGAALQGDLLPGQRLVTRAGDLWRWDGYRAAAQDAPSAAALRLQQLNRLAEVKQDLSQANARAEGVAQAHEVLTRGLAQASAAEASAREARRGADGRVAEAGRALSRAEAEQQMAGGRLETARMAAGRHAQEAQAARERLAQAQAARAELPDLEAARAEAEALKIAVEAARVTMLAARSAHEDLRREGDARLKRRQEITKELSGWRHRLETAALRGKELEARAEAGQAELAKALILPEELSAKRDKLLEAIALAETRLTAAREALSRGESAKNLAVATERDAARQAGEAREARARAEARAEAARDVVAAQEVRILEATGLAAQALSAAYSGAEEVSAEALEIEVNRLKRQREAMGAVNLRAEEDAKEISAEHEGLVREKADLEEAIRKLRSGISGLNREGRDRLLTAFEQVNTSFRTLFTHLFGGGDANLMLVESDDPLEAGLEIMCQPPGKKLSTLSLLSGGEQTLTAMALIFAVFLANPAPICVLDEVDAPLDDANVTRFCDLLDEMTRRTETRFLIITHHGVTMARMDRLFGVTMGEQGVSQLVSVDLKKAEELVG